MLQTLHVELCLMLCRLVDFYFLLVKQTVLEFTTLCYYYIELGLVIPITWKILYLVHNEKRFLIQHTPKDYMLSIQVGSRRACDEELPSYAVFTSLLDIRWCFALNLPMIDQRIQTLTIANRPGESNFTSKLSSSKWSPYMLKLPVPSPYRKETRCSTYFHKITSLNHKTFYNSMSLHRSPNPYLWNFAFLYPIGILDTRYSPVQNCLHISPPAPFGIPEVLHCLQNEARMFTLLPLDRYF